MPLAPFSFVDGTVGKGPRETKLRAAVAGLLSEEMCDRMP